MRAFGAWSVAVVTSGVIGVSVVPLLGAQSQTVRYHEAGHGRHGLNPDGMLGASDPGAHAHDVDPQSAGAVGTLAMRTR